LASRSSARFSIFALEVFSPGSGIGLHLRPLALGTIHRIVSLLLGVLHRLFRVVPLLCRRAA
jgi:hypothetical protein